MRVGTQGLFRPYLKTFVALFLPTRLTAPWSPRMGIGLRMASRKCRLLLFLLMIDEKMQRNLWLMCLWKSDEKFPLFYSLLFFRSKAIFLETFEQVFGTLFHRNIKHLELFQKYSASCSIFNSLLGA